jgi:hypothetical protein
VTQQRREVVVWPTMTVLFLLIGTKLIGDAISGFSG